MPESRCRIVLGARPTMTGWYTKSLGDALTAGEPLSRLEALFRSEYVKTGGPRTMALFTRLESEGRLHCEVRAYLSPASAAVARAIDADPCDRPSADGLSLLAGAPESCLTLFPDRTG